MASSYVVNCRSVVLRGRVRCCPSGHGSPSNCSRDCRQAGWPPLADVVYSWDEQTAAISPGSSLTHGMVSVPCSMKTLAAIRTGNAAPAHRKPVPSNRSVPARQENNSHILARAPSSPTVFATPESTAPLRSPDGTACCSLPRLLGSETDLTVCQPRCSKNPQTVPWICGAVENGRSIDTSINRVRYSLQPHAATSETVLTATFG